MDTNQLICAIDCDEFLKSRVGVFPLDLIPKNIVRGACICNIDTHDKPGRHWVALYKNGKTCEFFDSYGKPPLEYSRLFKAFYGNNTVLFNSIDLQSENTNVCGYYSLFYLILRMRGYSMKDILNHFDVNNTLNNDLLVYKLITNAFPYCIGSEFGKLRQRSECKKYL